MNNYAARNNFSIRAPNCRKDIPVWQFRFSAFMSWCSSLVATCGKQKERCDDSEERPGMSENGRINHEHTACMGSKYWENGASDSCIEYKNKLIAMIERRNIFDRRKEEQRQSVADQYKSKIDKAIDAGIVVRLAVAKFNDTLDEIIKEGNGIA